MKETWSRSSPPAGSRARKIWEPEEVAVLILLRRENLKVSWVQMQNIFNANVPSSRHRTSDALACKYKTVKSTGVLPPSQPDSQVQNDLAGNVFLQQAPPLGITNDHVSSELTF